MKSYAKVCFWIAAGAALVSLAVYVGAYYLTVKRVIRVVSVAQPPPLVGTRQIVSNGGPIFPKGYQQAFRPMYEIDRKWIRSGYWAEVPQLTPYERAAFGVASR